LTQIEHWGEERCKKTSEKLERQQANNLEVKKAEIAHDENHGTSALPVWSKKVRTSWHLLLDQLRVSSAGLNVYKYQPGEKQK
jgi:hypothetical protein